MDKATCALSRYVQDKGVSVAQISEKTGIPYNAILPSLRQEPTRKLRAEEYLLVCRFLDVDPKEIWDSPPTATPPTDKRGA